MTVALSILLLINAVFTALVWPTFYRRVAKDPRARDSNDAPTRFLTVHRVIVGLAYLIAVVSAVAAIASLIGAW